MASDLLVVASGSDQVQDLALAERAEPEIRGPDQVEWLERLEQENGNLRAAMGWALSQDDVETAARLGLVAMARSDHEEAASFLQAALQSLRESDEDYGVALVHTFLGILALMGGDEDRATPMFEESLAVARRLGDRPHTSIALYNLA